MVISLVPTLPSGSSGLPNLALRAGKGLAVSPPVLPSGLAQFHLAAGRAFWPFRARTFLFAPLTLRSAGVTRYHCLALRARTPIYTNSCSLSFVTQINTNLICINLCKRSVPCLCLSVSLCEAQGCVFGLSSPHLPLFV